MPYLRLTGEAGSEIYLKPVTVLIMNQLIFIRLLKVQH